MSKKLIKCRGCERMSRCGFKQEYCPTCKAKWPKRTWKLIEETSGEFVRLTLADLLRIIRALELQYQTEDDYDGIRDESLYKTKRLISMIQKEPKHEQTPGGNN